MNRLEKYLCSIADDVIYSEISKSYYLVMDSLKIRISDHFSKNSDGDLEIIMPDNSGNKYIVLIFGYTRCLSYNAKQIKELIPTLKVLKRLQKSVTAQKIPVPTGTTAKLKYGGEMIGSKIHETTLLSPYKEIFMKKESVWTELEARLLHILTKLEFKRASGITGDFQVFLRCTPISYIEAINLFKIIVIDNNKKVTTELLHKALQMIRK